MSSTAGHSTGEESTCAEDVICRICLSIMICPVTLPCGHDLCLECFNRSVDLVSLRCPFCRLRISCWARKAKSENQLVDRDKWNRIQKRFPELVAIKNLDLLDEELLEGESVHRVMASEGEIKTEFEEMSRREREREMAEEMASKQLILQILEEEQRMRAKISEETADDEQIARALQQMDPHVKTLRGRTYTSE